MRHNLNLYAAGKGSVKKKITRCGCLAMVAIKLTKESKCIITTFVEQHKPALVSPDKQHPIRSNREVGEKVKNTLFNFHRASIGTSNAYCFLRVGIGTSNREVKVLGKVI
jgi:hypothetical protein